MLRFDNDYAEGCIPEILESLCKTNMEQTPGYRLDEYCKNAEKKIREACKSEYLDVHFLVGGTQANMTVLDAILRPHQGCVSPLLGHINVHESGAIEGRGHKVLAISNMDYVSNELSKEKALVLDKESKISPIALDNYLSKFFAIGDWHMVQPGAVYISHPTERGALYSKQELIDIKNTCDKFNLPLFLDGARLSYALASNENDITLEDLAKHTDIFYIGGTKCGALFGEAVCFTSDKFNNGFNCITKHNGAVIAKGRLLGLQFDTLFTDDLYIKKSVEAYKFAIEIKDAFKEKGIDFVVDSFTNQQFPILNKKQQDVIKSFGISFIVESNINEYNDVTRFCTNWATTELSVRTLKNAIMCL